MLYEYKKPDICPYTKLLDYEQEYGATDFTKSLKKYLSKNGFLTQAQLACLDRPPPKYNRRGVSLPEFEEEERPVHDSRDSRGWRTILSQSLSNDWEF